jgi:hypothetical protein
VQLTLLLGGRVSPRPADHKDSSTMLLFDALPALHPGSAADAVMRIIERLDLSDSLTKDEQTARMAEQEQARRHAGIRIPSSKREGELSRRVLIAATDLEKFVADHRSS